MGLNNNELTQHKNEKTDLIIGTSDYDERTSLFQHKKKKGRPNLHVEAYSDFDKSEPAQHKKVKNESFNEIKTKHHKKEKRKEKPNIDVIVHSDFDKNELVQHEKEINKLFTETSCYETKSQHHKKKKRKEKPDSPVEAYSDFDKNELIQHGKEKNELFPETSCYETKPKHHKKIKSKEKPDLSVEACSDFDKNELIQHVKEKDELFTEASCYETKSKHYKKKKRKEKPDSPVEACSDFDKNELIQHGKEKNELFPETSCYETKSEHHKKKKRKEKPDSSVEACSDFDKNELIQHVKEKDELFTEASCYKTKSKHYKKKKRKEKPDSPVEACSDLDKNELIQHGKENDELFTKTSYFEIKSNYQKKKNRKEKSDLLSETYSSFNRDKLAQDKNNEAELFVETSHYDEGKSKHNKEKPVLFDGAYSDFDKNKLLQCDKEKDVLFVETSSYDEANSKHHKKKKRKEKSDPFFKTYTDEHAKPMLIDELSFETSDYDETRSKHHKKNKGKEKTDLLVETYTDINRDELAQHVDMTDLSVRTSDHNKTKSKYHKNKRKEKSNLLDEAYTDLNQNELRQCKKRKAFIEISDYDKTELNHQKKDKEMLDVYSGTYDASLEHQQHSKKKRKKSNLLNEEYDYDKTQFHEIKNISEEINTTINGQELKPHKEKKTTKSLAETSVECNQHKNNDKIESPDVSLENFQSEESIGMNLPYTETYDVSEINLDLLHKHKKKNKGNRDKMEIPIKDNIIEHSEKQNKHKHYGDINDKHEPYLSRNKKRRKYLSNTELYNFDQHLSSTETQISDNVFDEELLHSSALCSDEKECNYVNNGFDKTIISVSDSSHKYSHKKKRHLKNSTSTSNKLDDVDNHKINKKYQAVGVMDCNDDNSNDLTVENLRKTSEIKNSPCLERSKYTHFSSNIDDSEDPVDFEIPPLHQFETAYKLSAKQKEKMLTSEVFIKPGKFTAAEDEIIKKNFECFVKEFGVSDPVSLLGIGRKVKDPEIFKFLKAKHFYVRLAKDLNDRTLHIVYKRARLILHPYKDSGELTEKEIEHLKRLYVNFSNDWHKIGDTLGYTAEKCAHAYKWHEKNIAKGKFTKEEETKLIEALQKVSHSSDISCKKIRHINWDKVASYIPSRNSSQCRLYWANNLAWSPGSARKKWNKSYRKLVSILKEMNVQNPSEINWFEVYKQFEDFAPSDYYVLKRWLYLRSRIPDYKTKTFKEVIEILCNKYSLK